MEEPLALPDSHIDLVAGFQVMAQEFSIPDVLGITQEPGLPSKILADDLQGLSGQSRRPSGSLAFLEPGEAVVLETVDPVLDRPSALPQKACNVVGAQTGTGQKYPVKPMVIAGFFRPLNLILDGQSHDVRIRNFQASHDGLLSEVILSEITKMRNYL